MTIRCERCESKFENVKDLEKHMYCHTQAKYLCDECDFFALNYWTVTIHEGKEHDKLTCGLYDYKTTTIASLELHLTTCEIYSCKECDFNTRQISEMKHHEKENICKCDEKCTWHIKLNRNNKEEANMKLYKNSDLF